jgi:hypothetical protein
MRWKTERTDEFEKWWERLAEADEPSIAIAVEKLEKGGPGVGWPLVDTVRGSKHPNMKELRPTGTIRVFFAFDPRRKAVFLIGGDKAGKTKRASISR